MKNKKIFRTFAALCTCLMLMGGFSVTAFAQGTDPAPTATPAADATNDSNVVVEETEDSPALTPEGNAALVDDFGGNKQLITVTTKAGNYCGGAAERWPRPCDRAVLREKRQDLRRHRGAGRYRPVRQLQAGI